MAFNFHHRKLLSQIIAVSKLDYPCSKCNFGLNKTSSIPTLWILVFCFLGVGVVIFFGYYMILRKYRMNLNNRRRNLHHVENTHQELLDENQGPAVFHPIWLINTVGLQETIIESITVFKYKKNDALVEGTDCSVCLSEFEEDESLRLLPKCSHAFHIPCIDTWLRSHKNCPLCRAPIVCENAQVSVVEPNHHELGSIEESPLENSANHVSESSESSVGAEEVKIDDILERNSRNLNGRVLSDLVNHSGKMDEGFEPVRRSVSMDSAAASMIYLAVANEGSSNSQMVQEKKPNVQVIAKKNERNLSLYRVMKSCSFGRSLPKGPVNMKRSFSSTEKSHKNGYSRSHDSIIPL